MLCSAKGGPGSVIGRQGDVKSICRYIIVCLGQRGIQVVAVGLSRLRRSKDDGELATAILFRSDAKQAMQPARRKVPHTSALEDVGGAWPRKTIRAGHVGHETPLAYKAPFISLTVPVNHARGSLAHVCKVGPSHLCLTMRPGARIIEADRRAAHLGANLWEVIIRLYLRHPIDIGCRAHLPAVTRPWNWNICGAGRQKLGSGSSQKCPDHSRHDARRKERPSSRL
mmetsp:Transcript_79366/g.190515  ORF Transcript_79366/g.190515 Transcript_79366/m.190515 type:complete len:226 (-) Transcript_79366:27-704(-)